MLLPIRRLDKPRIPLIAGALIFAMFLAFAPGSAAKAADEAPKDRGATEPNGQTSGANEETPRELTPEEEAQRQAYLAEVERREKVYNEAKEKLVAAMLAQRDTYTRYQNRVARTPADRREYLRQRAASRDAMDETYDAALDLFRIAPNEEAGQFIMTMVQHRGETDIYDRSTAEGAARLIDSGATFVFLFETGARSAICSGEFETARKLLKALDDDKIEDIDRGFLLNLDRLIEVYEEEQAIRDAEAERDDLPRVRFETSQGEFTVELFADSAPSTVAHFLKLVEQGFYEDCDFFQVTDHILALTGDPAGVGTGNAGVWLKDEHEREGAREAFRGALIMAKIPLGEGKFVPNSASSQFAITFLPLPAVSETQTVFGRVIDGMEIVSRLRRVDPNKEKEKGEIVVPPDLILSAEITRPPAQPLPDPIYVERPGPIQTP